MLASLTLLFLLSVTAQDYAHTQDITHPPTHTLTAINREMGCKLKLSCGCQNLSTEQERERQTQMCHVELVCGLVVSHKMS